MPRNLGAGIALIPKLARAEAIYLIELQFSGGTIRLNTGAQDVSWNGFTWTAVGGAIELDPLSETTDGLGQGLSVKLSGVDQSIIAAFLTNGHRGRVANIWLAHLHTTTNFSDNPELLTVQSGWGVLNGVTVTRDTVIKPVGAVASARVTWASVANPWGVTPLLKSGSRYPVTPGTPYTFSIDANFDGVTAPGAVPQLMIQWFDGVGAVIASPNANMIRLPGWNRYTFTSQAAAGAVTMRPRIHSTNLVSGDFFNACNAKHEPGSVATDYEPGYDAAIQAGQIALNPIQLWSGFMNDAFRVEETRGDTGAEGTVTVSTRLVSRLAILSKIRGLRTNVDSHATLFPGDTFFIPVPTLTHKRIKWGA